MDTSEIAEIIHSEFRTQARFCQPGMGYVFNALNHLTDALADHFATQDCNCNWSMRHFHFEDCPAFNQFDRAAFIAECKEE